MFKLLEFVEVKVIRNVGLPHEHESTFSQQVKMAIIEAIPQTELRTEPIFYLLCHGVATGEGNYKITYCVQWLCKDKIGFIWLKD